MTRSTVAASEGGRLSSVSGYSVLELRGSYREMGRQYGKLMKDQLREFYRLSVEDTVLKGGLTYEAARETATSIFAVNPRRFQELALGMAKTSGLPFEKLAMLSCVYTFPKVTGTEAHCSGIAAWDEYTGGRPLVFGRSFDYPEYFLKFNRYLTLVVYHPNDGSVPTAVLDYPGHIGCMTGLNREGVFLEHNDGTQSGGALVATDRLDPMVMNLSFLLDSATGSQVKAAISSHRAIVASIVQVADKQSAASYECSVWDTRRTPPHRPGLLVATNHFVEPSWNLELTADPWQSQTRRNNLMALCEKQKGKLNADRMREILDTPLDRGGHFQPGITIYMVVVVPAQLKMWVKALSRSDWAPLDLKPFLRRA